MQITSPGYSMDRTNHFRAEKDPAQRLIARYLPGKDEPGEANDPANRILDGPYQWHPHRERRGLRGWRMSTSTHHTNIPKRSPLNFEPSDYNLLAACSTAIFDGPG